MPFTARRTTAVLLATTCAIPLAGCGSSSKTSTSAAATPGGFARVRFSATTQACLKQHGLDFASGAGRPGGPSSAFYAHHHRGGPYPGAKGRFPNGAARPGGLRGGPFSANRSKLAAAFKACGVSLPGRFGGPPAA